MFEPVTTKFCNATISSSLGVRTEGAVEAADGRDSAARAKGIDVARRAAPRIQDALRQVSRAQRPKLVVDVMIFSGKVGERQSQSPWGFHVPDRWPSGDVFVTGVLSERNEAERNKRLETAMVEANRRNLLSSRCALTI
jgi:hypothetical protein